MKEEEIAAALSGLIERSEIQHGQIVAMELAIRSVIAFIYQETPQMAPKLAASLDQQLGHLPPMTGRMQQEFLSLLGAYKALLP